MKISAYVSLASLLALGCLAAVLWRSSFSAPAPRAQARAVEVERPVVDSSERVRHEQELEGLKQQVNRLNVDLLKMRNTVSNATGVPADVDSVVHLSPEEEEQRWLDHVQKIDRAFRDEPLSADWSEQMNQKIRTEVAADELTAGVVVDVHCRLRTCKLELSDADPRRNAVAIPVLIQKLSSELQNAAIGHDGDLTSPKPSALYLSKALPEDSVPLVARR